MFIDRAKGHREQPHGRPIHQHDSNSLVLIDRDSKWLHKHFFTPPDLTLNGKVDFPVPEKPIRCIEDDDQPTSANGVSRNKICHPFRGRLEGFHLILTRDLASHAHEHVLELFFESAIQIRRLRLIHIQIEGQHCVCGPHRTGC